MRRGVASWRRGRAASRPRGAVAALVAALCARGRRWRDQSLESLGGLQAYLESQAATKYPEALTLGGLVDGGGVPPRPKRQYEGALVVAM